MAEQSVWTFLFKLAYHNAVILEIIFEELH